MEQSLFSGMQLIQLLMLQKLDEMFSEAEIPYWITGGTLVGAIRHQGFIPHDDDVDIECFETDLDKIAALSLDPPFYAGLIRRSGSWEGHPVARLSFFDGEVGVDVFPRPEDLPEGDSSFPSKSEVFPLSRYAFHNIEVSGPSLEHCRAYLDRLYSPDWHECVCVWNHDFNWYYGKDFERRKVTMSLAEYNHIVKQAGVYYNNPLLAEESSKETFQKFQTEHNAQQDYFERFKKYKSERTWRWNQSDAEWRYRQQYGDSDDEGER
jgi:hypothetical protein